MNIQNIFKKIPQQGPLEYFVHHNSLHHYEDMNFFDAVKLAAVEYRSRAFMSELFYLHKLEKGLINEKFLRQEVERFIKAHDLQLTEANLMTLLTSKNSHRKGDHVLKIREYQAQFSRTEYLYYSDIIKKEKGIEIEFYTSEIIYPFMSSYFDFGSAAWILPHREKGMWQLFCWLHSETSFFDSHYRKMLASLLKRFHQTDPQMVIEKIIKELDISGAISEDFLFSLCLKHKGWSGFVKSLHDHPEYLKTNEIHPDLSAFLAILLVSEYAAVLTFSDKQITIPQEQLVALHDSHFLETIISIFENKPELQEPLEQALPWLGDLERQEIFHRAYEKTLYQKFINAYLSNQKIPEGLYCYQVITCMDDREESLRRYLEMDPNCQTFGSAGHFGLNIEYKGYFDTRYRALCPVNVKPDFKVMEKAVRIDAFKLNLSIAITRFKRRIKSFSQSIIGGYLVSACVAVFSLIPFLMNIINPALFFGLRKRTSLFFDSSVMTELVYKKDDLPEHGMSHEARLVFAESFLRLIGLTNDFSPFVIIMGHGSMSLNNPHRAAYDCGACGGGIGAVNARLMACILNEPQIRRDLRSKGLDLPEHCQFVGAYHNTCSDEVIFFDSPDNQDLYQISKLIHGAAIYDSQERSRRFKNLPLMKNPDFYYESVQARAYDFRQPRAEYGHSTNAIFIIGKRDYTHHLFLDRRAFLLSYDHTQDNDLSILKKLLCATIPVISGINLEYYFSYIDNEFYGAGTKLPHNVNGLVGVINGHLSDLRAGLPWQMVEIHQPVRLFLLVIADLEKIKNMLNEVNSFNDIITNDWINFAVHDPQTSTVWLYQNGQFLQQHQDGTSPNYTSRDSHILSVRQHIDFGHIHHGN